MRTTESESVDSEGVYTRTRKLVKGGNSTSFTIGASWPHQVNDVIAIRMWDPQNPDVVYEESLKICCRGNNKVINIPKDWGFEVGNMVTVAVTGIVKSAGVSDEDARVVVERRLKEIS